MFKKNKKRILLISVIVFVLLIALYIYYRSTKPKSSVIQYYIGDYHRVGVLSTSNNESNYKIINSYSEYLEFIKRIKMWKYVDENYTSTRDTKYDIEKELNNLIDENLTDEQIDELLESIDATKKLGVFNDKLKYNKDFFENNSLLVIDVLTFTNRSFDSKINSVRIHKKEINVNVSINSSGNVVSGSGDLFVIELLKKKIENINRVNVKVKRKQ